MRKVIVYTIMLMFFLSVGVGGLQPLRAKNLSSANETDDQDKPTVDKSSTKLSSRKSIESVIPVKRIPEGWVFRDELLASWSTNLPAVLSIIPDTTVEVVYHDEKRTTSDGIVLPVKRASVEFQYTSRLTHEQMKLEFVNVDFIYSTTNNNDSHYILEKITKKIKLKDTGFPQLVTDDIIKHKVLMEYGTPKEFDGVWHIYHDNQSTYKVRKLDERNLKLEMGSIKVAGKLDKAIDDTYSKQGIEFKKRVMVQGIDL